MISGIVLDQGAGHLQEFFVVKFRLTQIPEMGGETRYIKLSNVWVVKHLRQKKGRVIFRAHHSYSGSTLVWRTHMAAVPTAIYDGHGERFWHREISSAKQVLGATCQVKYSSRI